MLFRLHWFCKCHCFWYNFLCLVTFTNFIIGGAAPYTYEWHGECSSESSISNVTAGIYMVNVTDVNQCKTYHVFNITGPSMIDGFCYSYFHTYSWCRCASDPHAATTKCVVLWRCIWFSKYLCDWRYFSIFLFLARNEQHFRYK